MNVFSSQSQNESAKLALCVDEFFLNHVETDTKTQYYWNKITNSVLYTSYEVFVFWNYAFYFRMLRHVINELIPSGIMKYLVEKHYTKKWKFEKLEDGPSILTVNNLSFGFNIWLGCCLISICAFIIEKSLKLCESSKNKMIKLKNAKIHPELNGSFENIKKISSELIVKFRIKSLQTKDHDTDIQLLDTDVKN